MARALSEIGGGRHHVVDAEIAVLDEIGRSDFDRLQTRARMRGYRQGCDPVVICVFDLLVCDGVSLLTVPWIERKHRLSKLLAAPPPSILQLTAIPEQGEELFARAVALELEGIVAKRHTSIYKPGERSADWLKIKRANAIPAQRFRRRK